MKNSISTRMKRYEQIAKRYLMPRVPVIVRIDGRNFHSITKRRWSKKYSEEFRDFMAATAKYVLSEIQGADFCYCQSDEVSFLLTDYETIYTQGWFSYKVDKIVSISASLASSYMTNLLGEIICFDSRAFSLPKEEVCNYFIWRQMDATRNAIQMTARENFSHKELIGVKCNKIQEMLFKLKGINFDKMLPSRKRGFCVIGNEVDLEIPIFTKDREYIEKFVFFNS